MPQKRLPIFHKVSKYLKSSIVVAKMRKPIIPKLIFLKKSRKLKRLNKLLNYGFLEEYQFTPSSTPLIHYYYKKNQFKNRSQRSIYSILFFCTCLGNYLRAEDAADYRLDAALPSNEEDAISRRYLEPYDSGDDVDQRAERFIDRFYQEMKIQRQLEYSF